MAESGRGSLQTWILGGLLLGAVAGVAVNAGCTKEFREANVEPLIQYVFDPAGQIFLRLLFVTVVPLVFSSLAVGVARLGGSGSLGRVGAKTFGYFLITSAAAVTIGLILSNLIRPGVGLPAETRDGLLKTYGGDAAAKLEKGVPFGVQTFVHIIPKNPVLAAADTDMLAIIFMAILTGVGLTRVDPEKSQLIQQFLDGINEVTVFVIRLAMTLAPVGVFSLIFIVTSRFGFDLLKQLGWFVATVLIGLAIQMFVVFPALVSTLGGMNPLTFFRLSKSIWVTAFSTSSSSGTLPTSIKVSQAELGLPPPIVGFVLPLGATVNMNGTALFEGVVVLFLAQVFDVELTSLQQLQVVVLAVLMAVGAAGVPGGSIPLLAMVLKTVDVPPEGIALILGIDRLLDMCRTTVNVVGDVTAAVFVARSEAARLLPVNSEVSPHGPAR